MFWHSNRRGCNIFSDTHAVGSPLRLKFLGFSLYKAPKKTGIRIHQKSEQRFKRRIREITSRKRSIPFEQLLLELKLYIIGWIDPTDVAAETVAGQVTEIQSQIGQAQGQRQELADRIGELQQSKETITRVFQWREQEPQRKRPERQHGQEK